MKKILPEAEAMQSELAAWRRALHEYPETGMEVEKTAAFVFEKLKEMGYAPEYAADTGVVALAGGKNPGRCFLLRADMDALPIAEESGEAFSSKNQYMHACGHDMHTVMLLGAAKLLKAREEAIQGTVKLMFQPGEENLKGAKAMVAAGVLENPKVEAAAMFHVSISTDFPAGTILVPPGGPFASAPDWFEIRIYGKGGHGATPQNTVDPLNVMSHTHIALQAIASREVAPDEVAIVTVGEMHGGNIANVIPDTAIMKGTIRTFNEKTRKFVIKRVQAIAKSVAETFRAKAEPIITEGCPAVVIDGKVAEDLREALHDTFGKAVPSAASLVGLKMTGSEDFAYISQEVPAVLMMLSAGSAKEGYAYGLHHPKARFDEGVLYKGAAAYALAAMGWLNKNRPRQN